MRLLESGSCTTFVFSTPSRAATACLASPIEPLYFYSRLEESANKPAMYPSEEIYRIATDSTSTTATTHIPR